MSYEPELGHTNTEKKRRTYWVCNMHAVRHPRLDLTPPVDEPRNITLWHSWGVCADVSPGLHDVDMMHFETCKRYSVE